MTIGTSVNADNSSAAGGFRAIVCELPYIFPYSYIVASSTDENDIGLECEAVINEIIGAGYRIQSVVTPSSGFGTFVVYNFGRKGRN